MNLWHAVVNFIVLILPVSTIQISSAHALRLLVQDVEGKGAQRAP